MAKLECGGVTEAAGRGCEIIKCKFYKNGKCTDEEEFVNRYTGEPMCRHNEDAIPSFCEKCTNKSVNEDMYQALKATIRFMDDIYPADIFTGESGDEGPVRVVELRRVIEHVLAKAEGREAKC